MFSAAPVPDVRASVVGVEDAAQSRGEGGKVAVVDATVVQLAGKLAEHCDPGPAGRRRGDTDLHLTLDDVYGRAAGRRRSCLFPGSLPARC